MAAENHPFYFLTAYLTVDRITAMKEYHTGDQATVTGPLRLAGSLDDHPGDTDYDDVYLYPGEQVSVLYPTDDSGDVYVTGLESDNSQFIAATSLTKLGDEPKPEEDNITLHFAYPNGDEVQVKVTGFSVPEYGLAALMKAGTEEVLVPLAEEIQNSLDEE